MLNLTETSNTIDIIQGRHLSRICFRKHSFHVSSVTRKNIICLKEHLMLRSSKIASYFNFNRIDSQRKQDTTLTEDLKLTKDIKSFSDISVSAIPSRNWLKCSGRTVILMYPDTHLTWIAPFRHTAKECQPLPLFNDIYRPLVVVELNTLPHDWHLGLRVIESYRSFVVQWETRFFCKTGFCVLWLSLTLFPKGA